MFDDQQLEPSSPQRRSSPGSLAPRSLAAIRKARRGTPVLALVAIAIAAPLAAEEVTVRRGDTLSGIAADEGVPISRLVAFNAIANPNLIYEGQVLRIPPAAGETTHVIQPGETLGQIARRYDTTMAALVARNSLGDPDRIVAGRSLVIPDPLASVAPAAVEKPATTVAPASTVAPAAAPTTAAPTTVPPTTAPPVTAPPTTVAPTTAAPTTAPPTTTAPPATPPPTTPPTTPTPAPGVVVSTIWVVQQGDTVTSVAQRVGLSPTRLAEANRIAVTTALTAGQYLFVPTR